MKSIKLFLLSIIIICYFFSIADLTAQTRQKPEKVYRIVYVQKPNEWYQQQEKLWKREIDKNPKNSEAWENYYNAVRYAHYDDIAYQEKQNQLKHVIDEMAKAIPETFVYYLSYHRTFSDLHNVSMLEKAYQLQPDNPETYADLLGYYEYSGDDKKAKEFSDKLYRSQILAPGLMNYNYNVLMSVEPNGILITNGDNDTYPCWILQRTKGVRTDVLVLNVSISTEKSYLARKLAEKNIQFNVEENFQQSKIKDNKQNWTFSKERFLANLCQTIGQKYPAIPLYLAMTVYSNFYEVFKENLYAVGLAFKYSTVRIDNIALTRKNLEQNFRLDYLQNDWYNENYPAESIVNQLNMNYLSSMVFLAEHFKNSGEAEQSKKWISLVNLLAEKAGKKENIADYLKSRGL
ncbi:hypothetical protein JW964_16570 [candidate division KSB1 bacterium]|nr:hypothetical protein [candidate division KSB1 bacterium]